MSRPLTKDEWRKALAEDWSKAIQATYEAEIKAAVEAEREAILKICEENDTVRSCIAAIKARSWEVSE